MHLRLVQAKAKPGKTPALLGAYVSRIIPELQQTAGCVFACLLQGVHHPDDVASLTLWETPGDAEAYEKRGTFDTLMNEARPYLDDSSATKLELSKDLKLEASTGDTEPTVTDFPVSLDVPTRQRGPSATGPLFLRIVSVVLRPERRDDYHSLYINEILPALQQARGCRHAYLVMPSKGKAESLSITIWDSRSAAEEYERSGEFARLVHTVKHTFTDLLQWRLELDSHSGTKSAGTEEVRVEGYSILTMKDFGRP